jgi:hypothetical protein
MIEKHTNKGEIMEKSSMQKNSKEFPYIFFLQVGEGRSVG